jgi:hypothetical protein
MRCCARSPRSTKKNSGGWRFAARQSGVAGDDPFADRELGKTKPPTIAAAEINNRYDGFASFVIAG